MSVSGSRSRRSHTAFTPGIVSCRRVAGTLALCFSSSVYSSAATLHGCLCQCLSYHLILCRMSGSADPSWAQQDKRRVLVIDIRVRNIEHTQQFYEQHLGMRLWRRLGDLQQGQFTSVCGYGMKTYFCMWVWQDYAGRRSPVSSTLSCGYSTSML